ncbi:hypothetical protein CEXT_392081 [Caerostris extrusa]|uniref:Uncharacterized protein n=1 Tax=Caerostris extrusa TaxID=172846 RepID=A0AAV4YDE0_CAEEX|nr:hypothetical protein CEXT_392081 [Caerostris extrusa]
MVTKIHGVVLDYQKFEIREAFDVVHISIERVDRNLHEHLQMKKLCLCDRCLISSQLIKSMNIRVLYQHCLEKFDRKEVEFLHLYVLIGVTTLFSCFLILSFTEFILVLLFGCHRNQDRRTSVVEEVYKDYTTDSVCDYICVLFPIVFFAPDNCKVSPFLLKIQLAVCFLFFNINLYTFRQIKAE